MSLVAVVHHQLHCLKKKKIKTNPDIFWLHIWKFAKMSGAFHFLAFSFCCNFTEIFFPFYILLSIYSDKILRETLSSKPGSVTCWLWALGKPNGKSVPNRFALFVHLQMKQGTDEPFEPYKTMKMTGFSSTRLGAGIFPSHLSDWSIITQNQETRTLSVWEPAHVPRPATYGDLSLESLLGQVNSCCWVPLWISGNNSDRVSLRRQLNYFTARADLFWFFLSLCHAWIYFSCFCVFGDHVSWHLLRKMLFGNCRYYNLTKYMLAGKMYRKTKFYKI